MRIVRTEHKWCVEQRLGLPCLTIRWHWFSSEREALKAALHMDGICLVEQRERVWTECKLERILHKPMPDRDLRRQRLSKKAERKVLEIRDLTLEEFIQSF